jgi:prephenate dehydrogenase
MRIACLGLGLIGGSIARALHERDTSGSRPRIVAWSPTGEGPTAAAGDGVIDEAVARPEAAIADADLVILAGPAPVCLDQLDRLAGPWRSSLGPDAVITDVASTKAAIVARAGQHGLRSSADTRWPVVRARGTAQPRRICSRDGRG